MRINCSVFEFLTASQKVRREGLRVRMKKAKKWVGKKKRRNEKMNKEEDREEEKETRKEKKRRGKRDGEEMEEEEG